MFSNIRKNIARNKTCFILCLLLGCLTACGPVDKSSRKDPAILVGAEQLIDYLPFLANKRVGLLVNQTSQAGKQHLVDLLLAHHVNVVLIFTPEHGFRGDHDAGATVKTDIDQATGLPLISLYGENKKPSAAQMEQIDIVVFDIQDVGVRYYTYISSLHYLMEAAAEQNKAVLVLDRPNPNIAYVDGPVLDLAFRSFVGMHPVPLLHGMTVAELALMIKGEGWIAESSLLNLTVVPVSNYSRSHSYNLPVHPSPNLPNDQAIALYPSLGFFEATPLSVGRGTPFPFQVIGYDKFAIGDFQFTPVSTPGAALYPPLENKLLTGQDLRQVTAGGLDLQYLLNWYQLFQQHEEVFFTSPQFMDRLSGTDTLRRQIEQGLSEQQIRESWQPALQQFMQQRRPYLLYR